MEGLHRTKSISDPQNGTVQAMSMEMTADGDLEMELWDKVLRDNLPAALLSNPQTFQIRMQALLSKGVEILGSKRYIS